MELEELTLLLGPFAHTTKLIGGAQYPTLDSITKCWEAPLMEAYISSYLDLCFKSMSFDKEKKKEVQKIIAEIINTNTINTSEQTKMDQFFDSDNQSDYPSDNKLE
ncbi:5973_t:CDS:2 [Dentiscutata heterogama]|uniref:5973_t:CDS:1 n=1 Tax=Dentiscutata heterogama TaxID=1316150 RepID=A0ACA9P008_9GLOM|nr:5973_t:CDS:2 [Dentiscutata heterogama]